MGGQNWLLGNILKTQSMNLCQVFLAGWCLTVSSLFTQIRSPFSSNLTCQAFSGAISRSARRIICLPRLGLSMMTPISLLMSADRGSKFIEPMNTLRPSMTADLVCKPMNYDTTGAVSTRGLIAGSDRSSKSSAPVSSIGLRHFW